VAPRVCKSGLHKAGFFGPLLSAADGLVSSALQIIFLDEPTTGMDPVSRRQVWDVIESVKRERCVVLTTHSMEEADILGDTIGIMAKGRLRCIGNSVHLKSKFGAGYEITVMAPTASLPEVKQLFNDEFKPSDPRSSSIQGIAKTICAAHSLWSF
jgi:ABC-type multidrug transport system ATPase subunit